MSTTRVAGPRSSVGTEGSHSLPPTWAVAVKCQHCHDWAWAALRDDGAEATGRLTEHSSPKREGAVPRRGKRARRGWPTLAGPSQRGSSLRWVPGLSHCPEPLQSETCLSVWTMCDGEEGISMTFPDESSPGPQVSSSGKGRKEWYEQVLRLAL